MSVTDNDDYSHYYLPLLRNKGTHNIGKRAELPTAFVEFCDLAQEDPTSETPREYHNIFKPSQSFLPRIYKRKTICEDPPKSWLSSSCPTLALTKYKVPCTFTEGLSAMSKSQSPVFRVQRRDVVAANLPQNIKLAQEKNKVYFLVEARPFDPDKTKMSPIHHKALQKKGSIVPKKSNESRSDSPPVLRFAPNVFGETQPRRRPHVNHTVRPVTPYYIESMRPKQLAVIPKVVCVGDDYGGSSKLKLNISNPRQALCPLDSSRSGCNTSVSDVISCVSNAQIELPFSVLRDASSFRTKRHRPYNNITNDKTMHGGHLIPHADKKVDNFETKSKIKTRRFVVKMPSISGIASSGSSSPTSAQDMLDQDNELVDNIIFLSSAEPEEDLNDEAEKDTRSLKGDEHPVDNRLSLSEIKELDPCSVDSTNNICESLDESSEVKQSDRHPMDSIGTVCKPPEGLCPKEFEIIQTTENNRDITTQIYAVINTDSI